MIGYHTGRGRGASKTPRPAILQVWEDSLPTGEDGQRPLFNTASDEEIRSARVADVYFYRTMQVLRARGLKDTPAHAEVSFKTSDRRPGTFSPVSTRWRSCWPTSPAWR